jgi:hypothetical protein
MPFPLAHPAAVLPLRRFCPRHLSFPALVIGSLSPDVGYAFARLDLEYFSHRPLAGPFGFCLPVGLVLVLGFYLVRRPVARLLPAPLQRVFLPLGQQPAASLFQIAVSLLLGAFTHELLDALTHPEAWLVHYLPGLLAPVRPTGHFYLRVCDVLYTGCTFSGVAWLALVFLRWWEQSAGTTIPRRIQWGCALLLAGMILALALACRGYHPRIGLFTSATISVLLAIGFLLAVGWFFDPARRGNRNG